MYGSCLQNYFLNVDITTTHQITTAPTMKQAEEVLSPIRTAITRSRGPFYKFLTDGSIMNTSGSKANRVKLASTKKGIENFLTGSLLEIRPMRIDKLPANVPFIRFNAIDSSANAPPIVTSPLAISSHVKLPIELKTFDKIVSALATAMRPTPVDTIFLGIKLTANVISGNTFNCRNRGIQINTRRCKGTNITCHLRKIINGHICIVV